MPKPEPNPLAGVRLKALRELIAQYGGQKKFAEAAEMDPGQISQYVTGHRSIGERVARKIERVMALPLGWMDAGGAPAGAGEDLPRDAQPPARVAPPGGYVRLKLLGARAGDGPASDHPEVVRTLEILESHIRHVLRVDPAQLRLATAWGDSMAGTILHNDLMAIDISQQAFRGPAIYLFEWEGVLMVKRLSVLMDGRLEVRSDNPAYAPEYLRGEDADRLRIIGRLAGVLSLRAL